MLKLMGKKIFTILRPQFFLSKPVTQCALMEHVHLSGQMLDTKAQKNIDFFLRPFFLKTDAAGRLLILIQEKTDAGTFFFEIQTILSDIIQVRP